VNVAQIMKIPNRLSGPEGDVPGRFERNDFDTERRW
jgi:hypothetical protein